ncbi:MAG: hypothetical protein ACLU4N_26825 [Butyricimonas faecihominis]
MFYIEESRRTNRIDIDGELLSRRYNQYSIKQRMDAVDVVVRTDDFKGRRVKQEVVKV